jgi:hypothetical protein
MIRFESVAEATLETPGINIPVSVIDWLAPAVIGNVTQLIAVEDCSQFHFLAAQHQSQTYRTEIAIQRPGEVRH